MNREKKQKVAQKKQATKNKKNNTNKSKKGNKTEKVVIYSLIIIILILTTIGIWLLATKDRTGGADGNNDGGYLSPEETLLGSLETKLLEYGKEIFPEDGIWLTEDRREFIAYASIEDMKNYYSKDISMFNSDKVKCDLKDTYIKFRVDDTGINYYPKLNCSEK